jgi:hypothetical protein
MFFPKHYFSPLNTIMRKVKDPDPDPYLRLIEGGPKTCGSYGSGSPALETRKEIHFVSEGRKGRGDLLETYIQCITKNDLLEVYRTS